ncbi:MAG: crossover junction endodeoxyribonuclease RuvC [Firmicutes bacterium]|jgi:crossover junction endodeoxyribonuclease RuvC|nr:crossover junction endodeoxyribonuclease RuvC [Bacillota bacterium]
MLVCGVDPGIARLGYALVEQKNGHSTVVTYGCLETPKDMAAAERLLMLHHGLERILESKPDAMAVEELFFNKNIRTAITVAQARGIVLLAAAQRGLRVVEYTPSQVKQAVVGHGRAEKRQVQEMLRLMLRLPVLPQPDDAADALALAVCHAQVAQFHARSMQGGASCV